MSAKKKLKVGVFSFTGDEGCVIVFEEMLNRFLFEWKDLVEFKAARVLQDRSDINDIDVSFIEGAIATDKEMEKIKEIRNNSKKIVAIGSCAIVGDPSNHRNYFDEERLKEIEFVLKRFHHLPKVLAVHEVVKVDDSVPGCPMIEDKFIEVLNKYLVEFGIVKGK